MTIAALYVHHYPRHVRPRGHPVFMDRSPQLYASGVFWFIRHQITFPPGTTSSPSSTNIAWVSTRAV